MEKDIILPVNISMLQAEIKEQEQRYEKRIAELENKIQELNNMTGIFSARMATKYEKKLNKIKKYCKSRYEYYKQEYDALREGTIGNCISIEEQILIEILEIIEGV